MTALAAAGAAFCVLAACKDIPLLPKWDAPWNVPLPSKPVKNIFGAVPVTIPAGTSAPVAFTDSIKIDATIGGLLKQLDTLSGGNFVVTITKSIPLHGADTLFIANNNAFTGGIVVPITMSAANVAPATDSMAPNPSISTSGLGMLYTAAFNGGQLFVRFRGQVTYPGPGSRAVVPNDSVFVKLALLSNIAISK